MSDDQLAIARAIDALDDTLSSTIALCETFGPAQWRRPTSCPGWVVRDHVAHLAGIESKLLGRPQPEHRLPSFAHVVTDIDREIEIDVDVRRSWPVDAVLNELREVHELRIASLRAHPPKPDERLPFLGGTMVSARTSLTRRVLDAWTHGEDIRRAVGAEPDAGSPAAAITIESFLLAFDHIVERTEPGDGTVVLLELTGPYPTTQVVAFDAEPTGSPTTTLRTDAGTFAALCAGRIAPAGASVLIEGNRTLARTILDHMVVTP